MQLDVSRPSLRAVAGTVMSGYDYRIVVAGDARGLTGAGARFRLVPPQGVGMVKNGMTVALAQLEPKDRGRYDRRDPGTRYPWAAGYRYEAPQVGVYTDPDGAPGLGLYGGQPQRRNFIGSYYCHNRVYSPYLGRWTTPDPLASPWWNLWDYVGNNPLQREDCEFAGCTPGGGNTPTRKEIEEATKKLKEAEEKKRAEQCCCCVTSIKADIEKKPTSANGYFQWGFKVSIKLQYVGKEGNACTDDCVLEWREKWTYPLSPNLPQGEWKDLAKSGQKKHKDALDDWTNRGPGKCNSEKTIPIEDWPKMVMWTERKEFIIDFEIKVTSGCASCPNPSITLKLKLHLVSEKGKGIEADSSFKEVE